MTSSAVMPHHDNRFDFLRLLGAWLVLWRHSYPLSGQPDKEPLASMLGIDTLGCVSVAIFFVLSGYLVTLSLLRSPHLLVFARRCVVRIYPALLVVCLLSVLVLGPIVTQVSLGSYSREEATWNYLKTAIAIQIRFTLPGALADNPLPHTINGCLWSLPYEIKCYVAMTLLSLLSLSLKLKSLAVLLLLLGVMVARPATPELGIFDAFAGLDFYDGKLELSFAVGMAFAAWKDKVTPTKWLGLALIVLAPSIPHAALQLVAWVVGFSVLALWMALHGKWLPRVPAGMGDWSYGNYLYGFPVQQLLTHIHAHQWGVGWFVLASTLATLVLAGMSWHWIEKPTLRWK